MNEKSNTDTLNLGDPAPSFTLSSANQQGSFSLQNLIERGPAIVEFLRGTW